MPITLICQICKQSYQVRPCRAKSSKYCGRKCYTKARTTRKQKPCPVCGKLCPRRNNKYCSRKCSSQAHIGTRRVEHIVYICETCHKEFEVYPSAKNHDPPRFCSTSCFYSWLKGSERAPRIDTACLECGKPIRILKSHYDAGNGRYCNKNCLGKANGRRRKEARLPRLELTCVHCGKIFYKLPCQVKDTRGRFCSRSCTAAHTNRQARFQKGPTSIEQSILDELNRRNIQHEFQYPLTGWTIDFAFPEQSLAVEADGVYWHNREDVKEKDKRKDASLHEQGWQVLHFSGDQIRESPSACIDEVVKVLNQFP